MTKQSEQSFKMISFVSDRSSARIAATCCQDLHQEIAIIIRNCCLYIAVQNPACVVFYVHSDTSLTLLLPREKRKKCL